jgi:hypothetical protein
MAHSKYRDIIPFGLRMQPELKEKLEAAIQGKPKWSLNSEIVKRLEESLQERHELAAFTDGELIDELIRRWGREAVYIQLGKRPEP